MASVDININWQYYKDILNSSKGYYYIVDQYMNVVMHSRLNDSYFNSNLFNISFLEFNLNSNGSIDNDHSVCNDPNNDNECLYF